MSLRLGLLLGTLLTAAWFTLEVDGQDIFDHAKTPVSGKAGPGLEALDKAVLTMMARHSIPGASLAIAREGRLVLAKGYGWADLLGEPAKAETLYAISSLSKPITALAILLLIEQGKLKLDDEILDLLAHLPPPRGSRVDPRLRKVTIRHLLNHSGGWSRAKSGDPVNWSPQISQALKVPQPITANHFVSFMQVVPLDFEPGTQAQYSNVGYIMLGVVIEKVSGQSYENFVRDNVLKPMGITKARLHKGEAKYLPGEARKYLAGSNTLLPPLQRPFINAAGGWSASAIDMVRFLTALDGSRGKKFLKEATFKMMMEPPPAPLQRRADGTYNGLGWFMTFENKDKFGYFQDGCNYGSRTFMKRNDRGTNWVLLFNASMEPDATDFQVMQQAVLEVRRQVEALENYPAVDLFKEFP